MSDVTHTHHNQPENNTSFKQDDQLLQEQNIPVQHQIAFNPHQMTADGVLSLQRTIGNTAVQRLLKDSAVPPRKSPNFPVMAKQDSTPSKQIQRLPIGTYQNATPGGNGTHWDTSSTLTHAGYNNGNVTVPSRIIAVMRNPGNGGVPSVDPPGWGWLKTKFGRLKGQWVRFHIINALLGGPGNNTLNLVPTTHATNHNTGWRNLEDAAKYSASTQHKWTYVDVSLQYDNTFPAGVPNRIDANWGNWSSGGWVQQGTAGPLIQANPSLLAGGNYLPATQITMTMLRGWGLTRKGERAAAATDDE